MAKDIPAKEQPSFEQTVVELTNKMTQTEEGNWALPDDIAKDLDEATKFAVTAERRRRDTQSAYSKSQAQIKALQAQADTLANAFQEELAKSLSQSQVDELNELKASDPDAWRVKMNEYEQANREAGGNKVKELRDKATHETELERRERLLEEFNEANPDLGLTDDVIANELPPKYIKALETGDSTFEEFLDKAKSYLTAGKTIASGEAAPKTPDLSKSGGGRTPSKTAVAKDLKQSYKNEVY